MDTFSQLAIVLLAVGIASGGIGLIVALYRRPRIALTAWATTHSYTIVRCQYRSLNRGPFFRFERHNQVPVFYIVVQDQEGHTHAAWAKCEDTLSGRGPMTIEVRWDTRSEGERTE